MGVNQKSFEEGRKLHENHARSEIDGGVQASQPAKDRHTVISDPHLSDLGRADHG